MTASLPASGERLSAQLGLTERVLAGPRMRKLLRVVEDGLDRVEQTLARELKVTDTLADATTRYLYEAGGKRVRPMLTLLTAELGEGATDDVIAGATALEMTHLGSLYHDDVMDGADVIPPAFGFFLARSWRMHPAVARSVSELSYRGELAAQPATAMRGLDGVEPGLHPVALRHTGNATRSPEEAARVVEIVRDLIGRAWTGIDIDESGGATPTAACPLTAKDIIVVTPYNAQQVLVEEALTAAGFGDIPVGTVDKFQGQEAAVAIVSLAASSGRDAPRGLEFLLLRNRLNVAISRAMHTAYLVYSPGLLDDLPRTPEGVARLSGFARLVGRA